MKNIIIKRKVKEKQKFYDALFDNLPISQWYSQFGTGFLVINY